MYDSGICCRIQAKEGFLCKPSPFHKLLNACNSYRTRDCSLSMISSPIWLTETRKGATMSLKQSVEQLEQHHRRLKGFLRCAGVPTAGSRARAGRRRRVNRPPTHVPFHKPEACPTRSCHSPNPTTPLSLALRFSAFTMREIGLVIAPLDPRHKSEALFNRICMQGQHDLE